MALSKKKRQDINNEAKKLASNMPTVASSIAFEEDYNLIMINLNEKLENRLETFKSQAIPVLREAYQTRPSGILSVIGEETAKIRELTQAILETMESVKYPAFRNCAASCIKDIIDICSDSVGEQYKKANIRLGELLQ